MIKLVSLTFKSYTQNESFPLVNQLPKKSSCQQNLQLDQRPVKMVDFLDGTRTTLFSWGRLNHILLKTSVLFYFPCLELCSAWLNFLKLSHLFLYWIFQASYHYEFQQSFSFSCSGLSPFLFSRSLPESWSFSFPFYPKVCCSYK